MPYEQLKATDDFDTDDSMKHLKMTDYLSDYEEDGEEEKIDKSDKRNLEKTQSKAANDFIKEQSRLRNKKKKVQADSFQTPFEYYSKMAKKNTKIEQVAKPYYSATYIDPGEQKSGNFYQ